MKKTVMITVLALLIVSTFAFALTVVVKDHPWQDDNMVRDHGGSSDVCVYCGVNNAHPWQGEIIKDHPWQDDMARITTVIIKMDGGGLMDHPWDDKF
jgi:hypothetical protein